MLKPQPSQGGGANDARLVAQLRSGDGGDGPFSLTETVGGHILPDRGQQGLPLTADATPQQENDENRAWFLNEYPFEPVDISGRLGIDFQEDSLKEGYIQLYPGVHPCDGFFISVMKRKG